MIGDFDAAFFAEVLVGGLLSGVMYSLVAIGFVLIYKTSGVLNFAQGAQLLFAALTFVSLVERGVPFPLALLLTFALMLLLGLAIERAVLRPLVNQPPITLFMATLGLSYVIEGVAQRRRIGDAFTCDVEGRAVIDASANERQAYRYIHTMVDAEIFDRDQTLIMVLRFAVHYLNFLVHFILSHWMTHSIQWMLLI